MPLIIAVKVMPSREQVKWSLDNNGQLKCYLKSPPERGKANKELMQLIAKTLQISAQHVSIMQGLTTQKKVVRVETTQTYEEFLNLLGLESGKQGALF